MPRHLSSIERSIERYLELDLKTPGRVTKHQLLNDPEINNMKSQVRQTLFKDVDPNDRSPITIDEFATLTGTKAEELKLLQKQFNKKPANLLEGVELLQYSVSDFTAHEIANYVAHLESRVVSKDSNEMVDSITSMLEQHHGQGWHCFCITGGYTANFKHEVFQALQFKFGEKCFIIFRTPK